MKKLFLFALLFCAGFAPVSQSCPISFAWDGTIGADSYILYDNLGPVAATPGTATTVSISTTGTYVFFVTAWAGGIESAPSNLVSVTISKRKGELFYSVNK